MGEDEYSLFRDHEYVISRQSLALLLTNELQYSGEDQRVKSQKVNTVLLAPQGYLFWHGVGHLLHIERLYSHLTLYLVYCVNTSLLFICKLGSINGFRSLLMGSFVNQWDCRGTDELTIEIKY